MSTTLPLRSGNIPVRRTHLLAAASALLAAGSVGVTLAVSAGGGDDAPVAQSGRPATAQPDAATLYHRSVPRQSQPIGLERGRRAAERFHHRR